MQIFQRVYSWRNTDTLGRGDYNYKLSVIRTIVVKDYLVEHGLNPNRIILKGLGEINPVDKNIVLNRRVTIELINMP
ncbi:MAG: OmpA family protein [Mangrovibacterium sp.]